MHVGGFQIASWCTLKCGSLSRQKRPALGWMRATAWSCTKDTATLRVLLHTCCVTCICTCTPLMSTMCLWVLSAHCILYYCILKVYPVHYWTYSWYRTTWSDQPPPPWLEVNFGFMVCASVESAGVTWSIRDPIPGSPAGVSTQQGSLKPLVSMVIGEIHDVGDWIRRWSFSLIMNRWEISCQSSNIVIINCPAPVTKMIGRSPGQVNRWSSSFVSLDMAATS